MIVALLTRSCILCNTYVTFVYCLFSIYHADKPHNYLFQERYFRQILEC